MKTVRQFTFDVTKGRLILGWLPRFLKGVVGPFLPWARRATANASRYLRPLIEDRQKTFRQQDGNGGTKPVSWNQLLALILTLDVMT